MRRKNLDLTYKQRTKSIVDSNFDPWQITARDPREGVHRLINNLVSVINEMDTEAGYIERMFMPDVMDLSEPWVMYNSYPEYPLSSLYISGELATETVTEVSSIDEFLFGDIDYLTHEYTISGIPYAQSILSPSIDTVYVMGSGYVTEYDLQDSELLRSGEIDVTRNVSKTFYADINHPVFAIRENFRSDTISVTLSGETVPFELKMAEDMTGVWVDEFDVNFDGYIGEFEQGAVASAIGLTQQQVSPTVWAMYDWMDVNKDGAISESDYTAVSQSVPSAAPDVTAVIIVPRGVVGALDVSYNLEYPITKGIYRRGDPYSRHTDLSKLYQFATKVAYDEHTDVYYGINSDGTELRAYKYDRENDEVTSDLLLHVPRWNHNCLMVDLDTMDGHLFVLTSDGTTNKIYYDDIWGDTTWEITTEVDIPYLSGQLPSTMTTTQDGYFAITVGSELSVYSQTRDKAMNVDGIGYFTSNHDLELEDATPLKTIPRYIFNSFDSFAYSALGITRPLGCDNLQMRKIMMDFWNHPQGNDKLGMNFGLMREFGYENDDTIVSGIVYHLPSELTYSGTPPDETWNLYMNDYPTVVRDRATPVYTDSSVTSLTTLAYSESFEEGTGDWTYFPETPEYPLSQSSDYSRDGNYSLKVDTTSGVFVSIQMSPPIDVIPGNDYTASLSAYESTTTGCSKSVALLDAVTYGQLTATDLNTDSQEWVDLSVTGTIPEGTTSAIVIYTVVKWPPGAPLTYLDNVSLESFEPFETTIAGQVLVNDDYTDYTSGEIYDITGEIGSIQLVGGTDIVPDERIAENYKVVKLEGYYVDGYGDVIRSVYNVPIQQGRFTPDIRVRTYGDTGFLEDVGYIMSGEPTQALIDKVFDAEDTNPFTYGNAMTNMTPMDSNRISEEPVMTTVWDVSMSGLVTSLEEVELDL